jgi:hypothetical protein
MAFSVGVLYSIQEFLQLANSHTLTAEHFTRETRFVLANPVTVLQVSQECNWVRLTVEGNIIVTERGQKITEGSTATFKLRLQIEDLISFHQPSWAAKIRHGRKEALVAMPADVEQCFGESGLLDSWDDDLRLWWLIAGQLARSRHSEKLSQTGHQAESLSCKYEADRTGQVPEWICLDSNFAGFDVLSRRSKSDATPLKIEVKGSGRRPKEADFVLTRNEAETAKVSDEYVVHLWYVGPAPQLIVVPFAEVANHLPDDRGRGSWGSTRIPYAAFSSFRVI